MRLEHLRYLLEINKYHSISAAAQKLYLGQTTLSAIVKSMEQELGFAIFERTHNGVQKTPEGEDALAIIREIVCRFEDIQQLGTQNSGFSKPIPVITSPTVNSALALPLNESFLQKVPNGNLDFHAVRGEEVGPLIIKNDGNIGITYFRRRDLENYRIISGRYHIKTDVLLEDHMYLLVAQDSLLTTYAEISPGALENQRFAILPHFSSSDGNISYYSKFFTPGNRYTTFSDIGLIKQAILSRNMVSILTGYAIYHNHSVDNALLKAIPLAEKDEENDLMLCLIYRPQSDLSRPEKILLQCIKEYFGQLTMPNTGTGEE